MGIADIESNVLRNLKKNAGGRPNVLVTGAPGVGKCTFIEQVIVASPPAGDRAGPRLVNHTSFSSESCEIDNKLAYLVELPSFLDCSTEDRQTFETIVLLQIAYWLHELIRKNREEGISGPYLAGILYLHDNRGTDTIDKFTGQLRLIQPQIGNRSVGSAILVLSWDGPPNDIMRNRLVTIWKKALGIRIPSVKEISPTDATNPKPEAAVADLLQSNTSIVIALMEDLIREKQLKDTKVGKLCREALEQRLKRSKEENKKKTKSQRKGMDRLMALALGEYSTTLERNITDELRRWDSCKFPKDCACECRSLRLRNDTHLSHRPASGPPTRVCELDGPNRFELPA